MISAYDTSKNIWSDTFSNSYLFTVIKYKVIQYIKVSSVPLPITGLYKAYEGNNHLSWLIDAGDHQRAYHSNNLRRKCDPFLKRLVAAGAFKPLFIESHNLLMDQVGKK